MGELIPEENAMSQINIVPIYLRIGGWAFAAGLLLLPLLAMQVTDEVNWGSEDFVAAALLLGSIGLALEAIMRFVRGTRARLALSLAVAAAFLLIWAELAVGVLH